MTWDVRTTTNLVGFMSLNCMDENWSLLYCLIKKKIGLNEYRDYAQSFLKVKVVDARQIFWYSLLCQSQYLSTGVQKYILAI